MEKNTQRSRKQGTKSRISLFMAICLLSGMIGCAGAGAKEGTGARMETGADRDTGGEGDTTVNMDYGKGNTDVEEDKGEGSASGSGGKVMGRYMESMNSEMADYISSGSRMAKQEDGSLVLLSPSSGKWVSGDGGVTWEPESLAWFSQLRAEDAYIMDIAVSMDGNIGIIYCEGEKEGGTLSAGAGENESIGQGEKAGEDTGSGGTASAEAADGEAVGAASSRGREERSAQESGPEPGAGTSDGETIVESGADGTEADYEVRPRYMVFSPDGGSTEFEIPYEKSGWLHNLSFSDNGMLYAAALNGKIYEIDWQEGGQKVVAQTEGLVYRLEVWGGRIVCSGGTGITVLDQNTGEVVSDQVLDDFLDTQMGEDMEYAQAGAQPLLVLPAGEDILYLVCGKGIYRHVLGGNVVEQLADGALNSLGSPAFSLGDGLLLEEDEFLLLFHNGQLGKYAYDPNVPAVPEIMLRAYSLEENRKLKAAIAGFQAKHPEAYVRYDIGLDGNSSATREDALKKLNTEIVAGNSPDLFILDDLPMDSYMEKGILADLTPFLEKAGEGYLENILTAFEAEGKIQAVPTEFALPVIGGKREDVGKMKDLPSIAEMVRKYREERPEGSILGWVREKDIIKQFLWVCAPAWTGEDGGVDEGRLEEFFEQMKAIWDAEEEGITDKMRGEADDFYTRMEQAGRTEEEMEQYRINHIGWTGDEYMVGKQEFFLGGVDSSATLDMMVSYFHVEERKDGGFSSYGGQVSKVFIPGTIAGISQTSGQQEMAAELLGELLEESYGTGLSLKKENLREDLHANATEDGSSYASAGGGEAEDGTYINYEIYPASEEEIDRLIGIAEQAEVPYVRNRVLEKAVCEAGEKVLKGEMSAKEGVQEVKNRVALYIAE